MGTPVRRQSQWFRNRVAVELGGGMGKKGAGYLYSQPLQGSSSPFPGVNYSDYAQGTLISRQCCAGNCLTTTFLGKSLYL